MGESYEIWFPFTNTGTEPLLIELVTACKCTDLTWSQEPVLPGNRGMITAIYHTRDEKLGEKLKVIDILANTNPIIVEAKIRAYIE